MSGAALRVLSAGGGATLQDAGRHGHLRHGVTPAGPMDRLAHATANRALGNPDGATAIEASLAGLCVTAEGAPMDVALAGGGFRIDLDGRPLPPASALTLEPGARLTIRAGREGAWLTLALAGRIAIPLTLGSAATHVRSGFGGLDGRALLPGDSIPIADPRAVIGAPAALRALWLERPPGRIRVMLGPQDDHFPRGQIDAFLDRPWAVTARGDRMACFLAGEGLRHGSGHDIVSDGIAFGAIQVPGDGLPIVLMADRQPTGGYPKIATVIGADLGRLAQAQAGAVIRFSAVSWAEAVAALRAERDALARPILLEPLARSELSSEFLLGLNLIDGVAG